MLIIQEEQGAAELMRGKLMKEPLQIWTCRKEKGIVLGTWVFMGLSESLYEEVYHMIL